MVAKGPFAVRISKARRQAWNLLLNSSFASALRKQYGPITETSRIFLRYSPKRKAILFKVGNFAGGRKFNATISIGAIIAEAFTGREDEELVTEICGSYSPELMQLKSGEYWGIFLDKKNSR